MGHSAPLLLLINTDFSSRLQKWGIDSKKAKKQSDAGNEILRFVNRKNGFSIGEDFFEKSTSCGNQILPFFPLQNKNPKRRQSTTLIESNLPIGLSLQVDKNLCRQRVSASFLIQTEVAKRQLIILFSAPRKQHLFFRSSACDFLPPGFGQIDQKVVYLDYQKTSVNTPNNSSRSTNTNHEEKQKERHWLSVATSLQEGTPRGGNPSARQEHQLCFRNERQDQIHPQGETQEAPQRRRLSQQRFSWNLHPFS